MVRLKEYIKEHNWIVVLVLLVVGFFILWVSKYIKDEPELYILTINLGAALTVSAIAFWILSHTGQKVEEQINKEMEDIHKKIEKIEDTLSKKVDLLGDELIKRYELQENKLLLQMEILAETKKSGIVHIFDRRWGNPKFKTELIDILKKVDDGEEVLLMSNSLRDFFGPQFDNDYLKTIFEMLKKEIKFKILLLDPTSDAAKARALVEEKEIVNSKGYESSTLFSEIKTVAERLNNPSSDWVVNEELRKRIKNQISVRFFSYDPTTHLVITNNFTMIEQYHRGGDKEIRESLEKDGISSIDCFGGFVPVIMVENSSGFANLLKSHFNNIWKSSLNFDKSVGKVAKTENLK